MNKEPLFFEPIFKERIWGGDRLKTFGYQLPSNQTGECWAFAAHPNGQSIVKEGHFKGYSLGQLWKYHRGLFGHIEGDRFPLLTKILDANQDLSVQVHPDDDYANQYEGGELGKTECWYIIDCEEGAEIVYGHNAGSKNEFEKMIQDGKWNDLLRRVPIKPGDFFFVPSGTIHAIGKGTLILETQQNSDTTYRVYDYDRRDRDGNTRDLHVGSSIAVATIPSVVQELKPIIKGSNGLKITEFVKSNYFTVSKWELDGEANLNQSLLFKLVSVLSGEGILEINGTSYPFKKGDHILLPFEFGEYKLCGKADFIISHL
ncbi:mannose-6-phosphate isomerase, class I [Neobacillus vireti]|uniref:mannose-6-phosphate isomerase, class I n=1 Tax=Neobacillus vireti TaxID=220686 RepID=UPI002FFEF14E